MNDPLVAIIVLNWRKPAETLACLDSLACINYPNAWIIVVDNGSGDDSVSLISQNHPDVLILETGANLGYAGGNNVGIRCALEQGAQYICVLNNDVTVPPGFLLPLLSVLRSGSAVGVATPLIVSTEQPDQVWALGSRIDRSTGAVSRLHAREDVSRWRNRRPFAVDVASGAAMVVRREVFERVGLFDEAFYLYFEETDWCLRVRQDGYRIVAAPSSVVWHQVSATLGQTSPVVDYYMVRNHLRLVARHWSGAERRRILGGILARNLLTILAYTVKSHNRQRLRHRNARLFALRDAILGRWGKKGADIAVKWNARGKDGNLG